MQISKIGNHMRNLGT
ncbi:unnamed protein product [Victoria cruziana]